MTRIVKIAVLLAAIIAALLFYLFAVAAIHDTLFMS